MHLRGDETPRRFFLSTIYRPLLTVFPPPRQFSLPSAATTDAKRPIGPSRVPTQMCLLLDCAKTLDRETSKFPKAVKEDRAPFFRGYRAFSRVSRSRRPSTTSISSSVSPYSRYTSWSISRSNADVSAPGSRFFAARMRSTSAMYST